MPTLQWENKSAAVRAAKNIPFRLLDFVSEQSCGDDENFIVQGDNLDALNSLLPVYRRRVKCIYIDPPYNTHSAFEHYDDNFEHSEWLNFMYPRLELLREFLTDDGAIFISVNFRDEYHHLRCICDEILTRKILTSFPAHDGEKIIFAPASRLSAESLRANKIIFKQLPSEIKA